MNSGRSRYTSTPTYGRQKRGFGKRQTEKPNNTELDFTQKPAPDFHAPVAGATDPYMVPQGIYHTPIPQQGNAPLQAIPPNGMNNGGGFAYPGQTGGVQGSYPMVPAGYGTAYGETPQPFTGAPMPQMPPLANAASMQKPMDTGVRAQGYIPPEVMPADQQTVPAMQPGNVPQGMAYPQYPQQPFAAQMPTAPVNNGMNGFGGYASYSDNGQPPAGPGNGMGNGFGAFPGGQPPMKPGRPPINIDNWLKMLLYIILPVAFVLCIALPSEFNMLRYLFMISCAATIGMLWYRQSFGSSLRTGLTIGYGLMCIVVTVMMLSGSNSDIIQNGGNITPKPTAVITEEPTTGEFSAVDAPTPTPAPEAAPADTEVGQRLSAFMDEWKLNQIQNMLSFVMPSWRQAQSDAAEALFKMIANRTPLEYEIEAIESMSGDTSVAVSMNATIDKNNGNDPVRYRFIILMDKADGDWYVDPNSLATNDIDPTETPMPDNLDAIFTLPPRMTVTPVPPDDTPLYYNTSGGKYYHADPNCSAVNSKYLPMTQFLYGQINDPPFGSLKPCLRCGAPTRPDE